MKLRELIAGKKRDFSITVSLAGVIPLLTVFYMLTKKGLFV